MLLQYDGDVYEGEWARGLSQMVDGFLRLELLAPVCWPSIATTVLQLCEDDAIRRGWSLDMRRPEIIQARQTYGVYIYSRISHDLE